MSQDRIAKWWRQGIREATCGYAYLKDGTVSVRYRPWEEDEAFVVVAFTDSNGLRTVYNYTPSCLSTFYLYAQSPHSRYGRATGKPRYENLTYAQIGEGTKVEGISSPLIRKLVEIGEAHQILLPPTASNHPHYLAPTVL
jgi:hypothetical protein